MRPIIICCILCLFTQHIFAQVPVVDTLKIIQLVNGKSFRHKTIDSVTELLTIAGNAILRQGGTLFYCDSVTINKKTNVIVAFGNVRINQGDSINTYAQYLKYLGNDQQAYLSKNVRLIDKKGSLSTQALEYNLKTGIGKYNTGGRVVNGKTVITSQQGIYYADTKDVYFIEKVRVIDPERNITGDTLLYNMQTLASNFLGPTEVKLRSATIYTTKGSYDLKNNTALFTNRSMIVDSAKRTYTADNIAYDKVSGNAQLEGNGVIKDSVDGFITTANLILLNSNNNSFIATRKPVLIILQGKDTTYVTGDTLFSAYTARRKANAKNTNPTLSKINPTTILPKDSLKIINIDSLRIQQDDSSVVKSYLQPATSLPSKFEGPNKNKSSKLKSIKTEKLLDEPQPGIDNIDSLPADSISFEPKKITQTLKVQTDNNKNKASDSVRFFIAYHHVRIFNDSLQSVSDSLYYSTADSVFKLFQHPIVWSGLSQITGDTMLLFTKNKKADRLYVFNNALVISKSHNSFYNQMAGKTLNAYFTKGEIDYVRVKGSPAESIYFIKDNDSAYTSMNRATGEVIDIHFAKSAVAKVKVMNDVHGILYPIKHLTEDIKYLKNFNWLDKKRPKNKLELFE